MTNSFYRFENIKEKTAELYINGEIVDDATKAFYNWATGEETVGYVAPFDFRDKLKEVDGKELTVYIDSVGGDVWAASTIYSMLREHIGGVIVKITGIAASSASFIAMAGDKIYMAETAVIMIHNPMTFVEGNKADMEKAIERLEVCKNTILNAYERKTGLDREEISAMMDAETWFDYKEAMEKGFCDGLIENSNEYAIKNRINEYRVWNKAKTEEYEKKIAEINAEKKREEEIENDKANKNRILNEYFALLTFAAIANKK